MIDYFGWILFGVAGILWVIGFFYQIFTQEGYWDD